jgi:uncharacterized protein YecT (DUF1311 family)
MDVRARVTNMAKPYPIKRTKSHLTVCSLSLIVLMSSCIACGPKPEEKKVSTAVLPDDWRPSLEQVQEDLQESFDRNPYKSQQALNRASQDMADLLDARLFITYVRLMELLDSTSRANLFNEQKDWLTKRVENAQSTVTSKGGTLGPLEYSGAYRRLTEQRLAELEKRLSEQKKK